MEKYFNGKELYGDDFNYEEIVQWYLEESEGYAELLDKEYEEYDYEFHLINEEYFFEKLPKNIRFNHVLGFGAAFGNEFEPIISRIDSLTIVEPSDKLKRKYIGNVSPNYIKPQVEGTLAFSDETFDLITCFGVLHHIPNVSYVLQELLRVLKPGGYLLLREPIISMGDWRKERPYTTKNERGIPTAFFETIFKKHPIKVISKDFCMLPPDFFKRKLGKIFKGSVYNYRTYVLFDKYLSKLLKFNVKYHALRKIDKLAPQAISYLIQKE